MIKLLLFFFGNLVVIASFAQGSAFNLEKTRHSGEACVSVEAREEMDAVLLNRVSNAYKLQHSQRQTTSFIWPVANGTGSPNDFHSTISNHVDHDPVFGNTQYGAQNEDYFCGRRTYDIPGYNHTGIDIVPLPFNWWIMGEDNAIAVAAAGGTIIGKSGGNQDQSCSFSGLPWNYVAIEHADGSVAYYGHLKQNSLTSKPLFSTVAQGEFLGVIGSSGNSTGPHLHFEVVDVNNNLVDPFSGPCNSLNTASWWANQPPYVDPHILRVMTSDGSPFSGFTGNCPDYHDGDQKDQFQPGDQVTYSFYFSDYELNTPFTHTVRRPDGTVFSSFTSSYSVAPSYGLPTYNEFNWFNTISIANNAQQGIWKVEVQFAGLTSEHNFAVGLVPLPVELSMFKAKRVNQDVFLEWRTESEIDNAGFTVECSIDNKRWTPVTYVAAKENGHQGASYSYIDQKATSKGTYYRLLQKDFDGSETYSDIVFVGALSDDRLTFYPNPAGDVLHFSEQFAGRITIIDAVGNLALVVNDPGNAINVSGLSNGSYVAHFDGSSSRRSVRFMIAR